MKIGINERKEREKSQMREDIVNAAREILNKNGLDAISIRKIAEMIEYSPAIIYHYFKNKDEIIETLIANEYRRIVGCLAVSDDKEMSPEQRLKESAKNFVMLAVELGDSYQSIMLNKSPSILAKTSVLQKGAAAERPAVSMLCETIRRFPDFADKDSEQVELTAQIIWSAAFGLALRLTVENVDAAQRQRLVEFLTEFVLAALKNLKQKGENQNEIPQQR
jgi:AcrR family transcriptional regulator